MAGDRTLTVKILGDYKAGQAFAKLERDGDGIAGKLGAVGAAIGKVFIGAGVAATAFGVKAVLSASDLAETMSKVGVVFGDQQKIVTNFANQMAKDFGTPKREILDAASSIGLIGKASGLSQGDAAKMSTQLAKMAADASSFYNVPLPEALQAIQSGLVGEAEPMRRFGVLLNAQAVDAEAARLGLEKVGKEYTEGAKAQARASLIMKGMTDASGDLERTQGSLANRLKELKGRAANFATDVGTKLLPIVLNAFDLFEKWSGIIQAKLTPYLDDAREAVKQVGAAAVTAFEWIRANVLPVLESVAGFIKDNLVPILAGLGAAFGLLLGGAAIGALAAALASPIVIIGLLVAGVVAAYQRFEVFRDVVATVAGFLTGTVAPAVAKLAGAVMDQLGAAVEWVKRMWPQISEAIGHVMTVVKTVIETAIGAVMALWRAWGDDIFAVVRTAFDFVRDTINNALQVVSGIIRTVLAVINGDWGKAWDALKSVLSAVWDQIKNVVSTAIDGLKSIMGGIVSTFGEVLRPLGNLLHTWITEPLEKVIGFIRDMPGKISTAASGMFDGIKDAFRGALNWVISKWNGIEFKLPSFGGLSVGGQQVIPSFTGPALRTPNIPTLHSGGVFRAPTPGGEGLALLRDMETVLPPGRAPAASITYAPNITVEGNVIAERDLADTMIRQFQEWVRRNGSMGL